MGSTAPRVVLVTRETDYELLLRNHSTRGQAAFFLQTRGQKIEEVEAHHHAFHECLKRAADAVPVKWRRVKVLRDDLSRFLFEPDDTVVVVGQDGLVANVAKYLSGQLVVGINPDPARFEGVLVPHRIEALADLLPPAAARQVVTESRTMARARLDDGQTLLSLNELYIGSRTHQSSRYRIGLAQRSERHSSSGIIIATGTGSTGWAKSIRRQRVSEVNLPAPTEARLVFFVREAWPSVATGVDLTDGDIGPNAALEIVSEMNDGGVVFGDGIETDCLSFSWGRRVYVELSERRLELVRGVAASS